ncbi:MAG: alpha-xylosidase, partial [Oscillospiraceae bacterium]|nr:alpha-xylosidase [Oscillospiraceae bacterium]
MKFTDGYWLVREGFKINQLVQIIDYKVFEDKIILYITTKPINHKGDTIDGALITMEISIINESVVKIRYDHHKGIIDDEPKLELNERSEKIKFTEDEKINIDFKDVDISLDKQNWNVRFSYKSKNVTSCDWRSTAYITNDEKSYFREQLSLDIRETIYGLGERFTNFIKNGQEVTIWNEDGSTSTYQSYKNIPFYISSKNYGLFVNSNKKVSFEIGSEVVNRVQFSLEGENLEYYLILADTPKEVLIKYTDLTGKPALPPLWSFGLWLSTSFTTNYDEETVNYFVNKMHELDIPLSVFHYDCFWMKEYEWCNFKFDDKVFPNPKEMLKKLKDKGLKICVWINPYIAQKSQAFEIAKEKGYLIKRKNGSVWQWDKWQSGMGIVDFTNPDACNWFSNCLKSLIDIGVDCFKTDFGERIPIDVVYHNKSNPEAMHNYYSYLYNKVIFKLLRELKSEDAIVFARSGAAGSQKFPVHWGGDCYSSYGSMAESLRGGLSLTSSGFGFWSHDISGFESTATPDVYKRWVQFGLLSTHSRLHGSSSYRVPWEFGEEAVEVLRFFSKLKCKLSPYIFNSA